jgi:serine/threonine-protein kinase RsbW
LSNFSEILIIKSDKEELSVVEDFLEGIFRKNNLQRKKFNNVLLCVSEAIMNSIYHGNDNCKDRTIEIKVYCNNNNMVVEVSDEGKGFDYTKIDDPTLNKNLKKESGRGLHIIKSLCTSIEFKDNGSCICLNIDLSE